MAKELIINASLPEVRIALMEDGRIQELLIERQSEKGIVGNIYKGRVTRVLPGMQAAFVDIGLDKAAFLYVDDIYVHPKVMGDAEIVGHDDDEYEEEVAPSKPIPRPTGSFIAQPKAKTTEGSAEANAESTVEESVDTASLESHTAEHAESELSGELDDLDHEIHDAALDLDEDEEYEFEADSEESEESSEDSSEEEDSEDESDEESEGSEENESAVLQAGEHQQEGEGVSAEGIEGGSDDSENQSENQNAEGASLQGLVQSGDGRRPKGRNRRRGRGRKGEKSEQPRARFAAGETDVDPNLMPDIMSDSLNDKGNVVSDRAQMEGEPTAIASTARPARTRPEFRESRTRDRRIKSKHSKPRAQANIADLLREGQEVIVQVAKDPIATKGARLTCHVSLPGRHLVCMPTIDHVGVSRRIERDDERRRLRDFVERNRPRKMGFIVRTASGGKDPESWIKQDIDYLSKLWNKIRTRTDEVSAPALAYEDLNSVLRAIRDWVNEDIDKIIVDSRYHYNELQEFAERFMPALIEKIELYQGDIPIFDVYGISSELHRSLERRVWLKSGGYLVIDQAEALVAIDVNTGRFVGKKNLEDTILKTNLEACEEIAYQLRLRNCGGIIICDLIDMEREENKIRVYRALDEALKKDRARPTIQKISELGLIEMTRKRTRDTIIRTLCEPCVQCEGKGFTKSTQTVAYEILREMERLGVDRDAKKILISANESVIDILAIDLRDAVDALERRYNKTVFLQGIVDYHTEQFEVVTDRMGSKKQSQDIARQLRVERERSERKEKQKVRSKEDQDEAQESGPSERNSERHSKRNSERNSERNVERNSERNTERVAPILPTKKAEGAFVIKEPAPLPIITPRIKEVSPEGVNSEAHEGGGAGESQDQGFDEGNEMQSPVITPVRRAPPTGMEDEDQLAYLRAQAAQDAALAYGAAPVSSPSVQGRNNHPRNQNNRNQRGQQQNRNPRGGGRNDRGAGRGRPQQQRFQNRSPIHSNTEPGQTYGPSENFASAPAQSQEVTTPVYEVSVKGDGDGNNS